MPNYFKVTKTSGIKLVELTGVTIEGQGRKGIGNGAEQELAEMLNIPVEDIKEIDKKEYERLDKETKDVK